MTRVRVGALALFGLGLTGCLGEPPIEDRWTLLEVQSASPTGSASYVTGSTDVTMSARMTYRELLTGHLVLDLRASDTLSPDAVALDRTDDPLAVARDVDLIIQNSTSLGHDAVPVTGFDHLIREVALGFTSQAPATQPAGLFLLLYFSDDVEEVEVDGEEIEIVTPTLSTERDILSTGIELLP